MKSSSITDKPMSSHITQYLYLLKDYRKFADDSNPHRIMRFDRVFNLILAYLENPDVHRTSRELSYNDNLPLPSQHHQSQTHTPTMYFPPFSEEAKKTLFNVNSPVFEDQYKALLEAAKQPEKMDELIKQHKGEGFFSLSKADIYPHIDTTILRLARESKHSPDARKSLKAFLERIDKRYESEYYDQALMGAGMSCDYDFMKESQEKVPSSAPFYLGLALGGHTDDINRLMVEGKLSEDEILHMISGVIPGRNQSYFIELFQKFKIMNMPLHKTRYHILDTLIQFGMLEQAEKILEEKKCTYEFSRSLMDSPYMYPETKLWFLSSLKPKTLQLLKDFWSKRKHNPNHTKLLADPMLERSVSISRLRHNKGMLFELACFLTDNSKSANAIKYLCTLKAYQRINHESIFFKFSNSGNIFNLILSFMTNSKIPRINPELSDQGIFGLLIQHYEPHSGKPNSLPAHP